LGARALRGFPGWRAGSPAARRAARRALWAAAGVLGVLALLESAGAVTGFWQGVIYPDMAPDKAAAFHANLPAIRTGFWLAFLLAAAVAGAWELASRDLLSARGALVLLAVLAAIDLYRVDREFVRGTVLRNEVVDPVFFAPDGAIRFLQAEQARGAPFRVLDIGTYGEARGRVGSPNLLAIHGLQPIGGPHGHDLGRYPALVGRDGPATPTPRPPRATTTTHR